ncbi:MAG: ATP-binding domain-containing protein [Anaerolineae bacterium]
MAVLCHDKRDKDQFQDLQEAGVFVDTFHRMKGLEFPLVFIPHLSTLFNAWNTTYDETYVANQRRRLFTAMPRAQDRLVLSHHGQLTAESATPRLFTTTASR